VLRLLVIALLALNLLLFLWQWQSSEPDGEALVRVAQPADNRLSLADGHRIAEVPEEEAPLTDADREAWRPQGCLRLGGIDDADALRQVANRLGIADPDLISEADREAVAWWVLLPPDAVADPEGLREELDTDAVGDHFFIASGDAAGGVSFGLFSAEARAETRRDELVDQGFEAEIRPRWQESRRYWLEIPLGLPLDLQAIAPGLLLDLEPALCPDERASLVDSPEQPLE